MRYEKGHKDATRQRIIDVASRQFREQGVAAVGLAGIMSDAGLTNGAFYAHFDSKEDLVRQVLSNAQRNQMWQAVADSDAEVESAIRSYLSAPKPTRKAFTGKLANIIEMIAPRLGTGSERQRRRKAVAIYGLMVGTLQLARAVSDKRLSDEILQSGADEALALVGQGKK